MMTCWSECWRGGPVIKSPDSFIHHEPPADAPTGTMHEQDGLLMRGGREPAADSPFHPLIHKRLRAPQAKASESRRSATQWGKC